MKSPLVCLAVVLWAYGQTEAAGQTTQTPAPETSSRFATPRSAYPVEPMPSAAPRSDPPANKIQYHQVGIESTVMPTAAIFDMQPRTNVPPMAPPGRTPPRVNRPGGGPPRAPPQAPPTRPRSTTPQRPAQPSTPSTERNLQQDTQDNSLAGDVGRARSPQSSGAFMMGDFITGGAFGGQVHLNCTLNEPYGAHLAAPFAFHTFKIADNQSPWPRNRVYVTSEYYRQVGDNTAITREMFGFERVFMQNRASFGMVLPFFTADPGVLANPLVPSQPIGTFGLGTSTRGNTGDLTMIYKQALIFDPTGGNVLSVGAAVTAPTGPATIASVTPAYTVNGVNHWGGIQPYMAFYRSIGPAFNGLFLQGFSSLDRPFSPHDATFWFNDLGIGYYYRRNVSRGLTGVVPNFEVHVNTPLDGRKQTITGTPDLAALTGFSSVMGTIQYYNQVNLTSGVTFIFNRRTTLALAVVAPVATPHPFNVEFLAQMNVLRVPWLPAPPP